MNLIFSFIPTPIWVRKNLYKKKLPEKYRSFVIDHINKAVYRVLPDGNIIIVTLWDCRRAPETLVSQI